MLKILKTNLIKRLLNDQPGNTQELDYSRLPVMSGEELIQFLNQTNRIRSIKRIVMLDSLRFEKMYLEPIHRFAELAQLIPASQAYHHTFAGGLIIHTLSVIEIAITERQKHTLPPASEPEVIEAQRNLWTYAVFMAALCHDVGKIITMVTFADSQDNNFINIFTGSLVQQKVTNYRIQFKPSDYYELHQKIGACFLSKLFDKQSLGFVSANLDVFGEVLAYINNDKYDWGSIGSIVHGADKLSTAESLKINNQSRKFPGAALENFGERILRTLRLILNNKNIPKNRAGATFWTGKNHTYAVAKPFAELIREEMRLHGATDIPSDNTRIFDELQQRGFCETNADGHAIFKIEIRLGSFQQTFTCIKLQNRRLYHAGKLPQPLRGSIVEVIHANEAGYNHNTENDEPGSTKSEITTAETNCIESTATEADTSVGNVAPHFNEDPFEEASVLEKPLESDFMAPIAKSKTKAQKSNLTSIPSKAEEITHIFFEWLIGEVKSKEYVINRDSPLYIVEYQNSKHLALLSPIIFAAFAKSQNYVKTIDGRDAIIEAAKPIQKAFHQSKSNVGIAGKQVHIYIKKNSPSAKPPRLNFYLIPLNKISNDELQQIVKQIEPSSQIQRLFVEQKNTS